MFTPEERCHVFRHQSPTGPAEFFLGGFDPGTVGVILPTSEEPEEQALWDQTHERIAAAWQHPQVGFFCERLDPEDWRHPKPCSGCALARYTQVVVVDLSTDDPRAQSFQEMAAASSNVIQIMAQMAGEGPSLQKKVILIHRGPLNLPPHVSKMFPTIDYGGENGEPDWELLEHRMSELARDPELFATGEPIRLSEDELGLENGDEGTAVEKASRAGELQAPVAVDGSSTRAPVAPSGELLDEDLVKILEPATRNVPPGPPDEPRASRDPLEDAAAALKVEKPAEALRALLTAPNRLSVADEVRWRDLMSTCLEVIPVPQLVSETFAIVGEDTFSLEPWREEERWRSTRLTLGGNSPERLRQALGTEAVLCLAERLEPGDLDALYRPIARAEHPPRALILVQEQRDPILAEQLAAYARPELPPRVIELVISELRSAVAERRTAIELLEQRLFPPYRRAEDPYLQRLHQVVVEDTQFFGRHSEIERLCGCLQGGENVALFGLPRVGKTSLLTRLALALAEDRVALARVDLRVHPIGQPIDFYAEIARAVGQALEKIDPQLKELTTKLKFFAEAGAATPSAQVLNQRFVPDLESLVHALGRKKDACQRLILALDEVDWLLSQRGGPWAKVLESLIRLLADDAFGVVLAGWREPLWRVCNDERWQRLERLHLSALDDAACGELVRHLGWSRYCYFTDDGLEVIRRTGGRDPVLTKLLCSTILETAVERMETAGPIDVVQVEQGVARFLEAPQLTVRVERRLKSFGRSFHDEAQLFEEICEKAEVDQVFDLEWLEDASETARDLSLSGQLTPKVGMLADYGWLEPTGEERWRVVCGLLHRLLRSPGRATA